MLQAQCVKVDTVKKKSGLETLNSYIGNKVAENTVRWQHTTCHRVHAEAAQRPLADTPAAHLFTIAAYVQWVAVGYSGLHDAFDRTGLARLVVRR